MVIYNKVLIKIKGGINVRWKDNERNRGILLRRHRKGTYECRARGYLEK